MRPEFSLTPEESAKPERPRSPRRRMAFKGVIETSSDKGTVSIRNLSCTGAMVEGENLPNTGRDIILTFKGLELFGRVVWCDGRRCGLHFDEELNSSQVLELHQITPEQVRSEELNAAAKWYKSHGFEIKPEDLRKLI